MQSSSIDIIKISGTNAERLALPANQLSPYLQFLESDTNNKFEWNGNSWNQISTAGAANVNPRDASGNAIVPAFSPGTPTDLSATNASQTQALGNAVSLRLLPHQASDHFIRIKFVSTAGGTVSATTDMLVNCNQTLPPEKFYIPASAKDSNGNCWLAFIRDSGEGSNVAFQITTG